jgi:Sec-independent protein secretion pathway component TatC
MANKFFSWDIRWKRVIVVSTISALALFVAGFLLWYFFGYLPMARELAASKKVGEEIQQFENQKTLPLNSSNTPIR